MIRNLRSPRKDGFTLSELLIALAILGIIAIFTIPKILMTTQDSRKQAILKETLATIMQIQQDGMRAGQLTPSNNDVYFKSKLNAIKICTQATTEGCWTSAAFGNTNEDGAQLANGAQLAGFDNGTDYGSGRWANAITIDWNGSAGPNLIGDDIIKVWYCYGSANCGGAAAILPASAPAGRLGACPDANAGAGNTALYDSIFQ